MQHHDRRAKLRQHTIRKHHQFVTLCCPSRIEDRLAHACRPMQASCGTHHAFLKVTVPSRCRLTSIATAASPKMHRSRLCSVMVCLCCGYCRPLALSMTVPDSPGFGCCLEGRPALIKRAWRPSCAETEPDTCSPQHSPAWLLWALGSLVKGQVSYKIYHI